VVREGALDGPADLAAALKLGDPRPVILLFGGADDLSDAVKPRLRWMFTRGIARAAAEIGAAVIDGGTSAGVMEVMGAANADVGPRASPLIGVAPAALVSVNGAAPAAVALDPNHSHAVLTLGQQWGDERDTMLALAAVLARGKGVIAVVAGGGDATLLEVREAVRRRWRVLVVKDTGGVADRIAPLVGTASDITDPVLAEIVRDGTLDVVPLDGSPDQLADPIRQEAASGATLADAWQRFSTLDANAKRRQIVFRTTQVVILVLGLAAATCAVLDSRWPAPAPGTPRSVLAYVVLVIPIVVSVLVAGGNLFKPGSKWLLLRAAAEAVKREIFRYRTRAAEYRRADRDQRLAQALEQITNRLAQTEVNTTALRPYTGRIPPDMYGAGGHDDGLSILSADAYVALRVADQTRYYEKMLVRLHRGLVLWQIAVLALGGLGTLVAALGGTVWVAVTTGAVSAITTYLGYRQIEMTITTYNQARIDLENVVGWWRALPAAAKADPANVDKLVEHSEKVLELELAGWVQKMQDALAELRKRQEETAEEDEKPAPGPKA
jgi:hypothetical protein